MAMHWLAATLVCKLFQPDDNKHVGSLFFTALKKREMQVQKRHSAGRVVDERHHEARDDTTMAQLCHTPGGTACYCTRHAQQARGLLLAAPVQKSHDCTCNCQERKKSVDRQKYLDRC